MKPLKSFYVFDYFKDRQRTLESKLLFSYIMLETAWAVINAVISIAAKLPVVTIAMYLFLAIGVPLYYYLGLLLDKEELFSDIYFILLVITIPVMWYCAGGNDASANVLFVCEIIVFVMCLKGLKQKVFIGLSLLSTSVVYALSNAFPEMTTLPMTDKQRYIGSVGIGATTSLVITAILLIQKIEYARERDIAVKSEKELEKSNQMQKNFLANMSHEIRSPLGIVLGFNTLISETDDIGQIHEYSKNITHAGQTLQIVINDILDYSKIESGKLDIIEADYSFMQLMSDICTDIKLKCDEKGLSFKADIDHTMPRYLYGDDIRIKQCILNLLSNAVKYTSRGEVGFTVRNEGTDDKGDYRISFRVSDTGKGMPEEELPYLFTSFQRLDENNNRGIEGTGLGLAITKSLMDEMHGSIDVESKVGAGSVFTLNLTQKKSNIQTLKNEENRKKVSLEGVKILAVDDTKLNLVLIRKILLKTGAVIDTADSGRACLDACREKQFDIILLDHMMPEMDGVETFKELKQMDDFKTPVIMLTANAMAGAKQEYIQMGFDGYVSKPVNQDELISVISRAL